MPKTNYKGSAATREMVEEQIILRFGEDEAVNYDPYKNVMTFNQWRRSGFKVKRGEKSLRSVTFVEVKDDDGEVVRKYKKTVHLFCWLQVEPIKA